VGAARSRAGVGEVQASVAARPACHRHWGGQEDGGEGPFRRAPSLGRASSRRLMAKRARAAARARGAARGRVEVAARMYFIRRRPAPREPAERPSAALRADGYESWPSDSLAPCAAPDALLYFRALERLIDPTIVARPSDTGLPHRHPSFLFCVFLLVLPV